MNIHTVDKVGFWAVLDSQGSLVAVVHGNYEAVLELLDAVLPDGTAELTAAKTADGPFRPVENLFGSAALGEA